MVESIATSSPGMPEEDVRSGLDWAWASDEGVAAAEALDTADIFDGADTFDGSDEEGRGLKRGSRSLEGEVGC